jgi:hypothetical protein
VGSRGHRPCSPALASQPSPVPTVPPASAGGPEQGGDAHASLFPSFVSPVSPPSRAARMAAGRPASCSGLPVAAGGHSNCWRRASGACSHFPGNNCRKRPVSDRCSDSCSGYNCRKGPLSDSCSDSSSTGGGEAMTAPRGRAAPTPSLLPPSPLRGGRGEPCPPGRSPGGQRGNTVPERGCLDAKSC